MSVATAMCTTFKQEILQGIHNFQATVTPTANTNTSTLINVISSMTGIVPGMTVSGSGVPAGAIVVSVNTAGSSVVISQATTTTLVGTTITFAGDVFKMPLFISATTGTWAATATNYGTNSGGPTTSNIGTDELATGGGYTAGGTTLVNVSPVVNSTGGITNFSPNPQWTSATFSTSGCMIYNSTKGLRTIAIYSFGGTQTVTAGTFTVQMPVAALGTAVIGIA